MNSQIIQHSTSKITLVAELGTSFDNRLLLTRRREDAENLTSIFMINRTIEVLATDYTDVQGLLIDSIGRDDRPGRQYRNIDVDFSDNPTFNIQHSTFNIQHPTSNIQHPKLIS